MKITHSKNKLINFGSAKLHPIDLAYKKLLQKGLKDTFHINCKIEDLDSIAGPIELKQIITKLLPEHYIAGKNFRANFHIHTIASDGDLTVKEFLEKCTSWANYIFKKKNSTDTLPAFSAAITDHDRIKSAKEAIALISQHPDKYKNFKFVSGCEYLFHSNKEQSRVFEAVGLGFNPFDEKLKPLMQGFASNNDISDAKKVIEAGGILSLAHPLYSPQNLTDDFFKLLKEHNINGIEKHYQYLKCDKEYITEAKKLLAPLLEKYKMFETGGTDTHKKSIFKQ